MRLPGYCTTCRRIKQVRVSNAGMVNLARGGHAMGICDSCQTAEDKKREEARRPQ